MSAQGVSDKNLVGGSKTCESVEMLPQGSTPVSPEERKLFLICQFFLWVIKRWTLKKLLLSIMGMMN